MELPDLGEHCALQLCKQLDFLPFKCDACSRTFCKDHVTYEKHNCEPGLLKDRKVPVCPLCNQPISLSASENADRKVNEHIENHCKSDLAKHQRSGKCNVKGCKKRELIPVTCERCRKNFCLRHRHEADHSCTAIHTNQRSNKTAAVRQSGLAATSRYKSSSPSNISNNKQNNPPQSSLLSTVGADLNRQRGQRQQTSLNQMSSMHSQNMSEDQALALALQASLASSSSASSTPQPTPTVTAAEDEDAALARAIAESEKEERERQRKKQHKQSTDKDKDSCAIS